MFFQNPSKVLGETVPIDCFQEQFLALAVMQSFCFLVFGPKIQIEQEIAKWK